MSAAGREATSSRWSVVRAYLVERDTLFARIREQQRLGSVLGQMVAVSSVCGALYGVTVGVYAGGWQPLFNAVKFPGMLLATLALCVLALYMLSALTGGGLSLRQVTATVLSAILVTTLLLLALTPPLGFLMLTSDRNYPLTVLANLIAIVIAGACGARFALQATAALYADDPDRRAGALRLMKGWMLLYGLVGLQMLWIFRPYFRATGVFIRPLAESGNAFVAFGNLLLSVLSGG